MPANRIGSPYHLPRMNPEHTDGYLPKVHHVWLTEIFVD